MTSTLTTGYKPIEHTSNYASYPALEIYRSTRSAPKDPLPDKLPVQDTDRRSRSTEPAVEYPEQRQSSTSPQTDENQNAPLQDSTSDADFSRSNRVYGFEETVRYVEDYTRLAASLRRDESINTYIDNSGEFSRIGERKSLLPINQLETETRQSVRYVGLANDGELNRSPEMQKYSLMETTRAIEAYNQVAQQAKEAQNHATYLQNSMLGLSPLNYLGSA